MEKVGKVARTDEQIKLAIMKLVIENLFVCKRFKSVSLYVIKISLDLHKLKL